MLIVLPADPPANTELFKISGQLCYAGNRSNEKHICDVVRGMFAPVPMFVR